jgi:hypothetical protein
MAIDNIIDRGLNILRISVQNIDFIKLRIEKIGFMGCKY